MCLFYYINYLLYINSFLCIIGRNDNEFLTRDNSKIKCQLVPKVLDIFKVMRIIKIAGQGKFFLFLSATGIVYVLGRATNNVIYYSPIELIQFKNTPVRDIGCGETYYYIHTKTNRFYLNDGLQHKSESTEFKEIRTRPLTTIYNRPYNLVLHVAKLKTLRFIITLKRKDYTDIRFIHHTDIFTP